MARYLVTGGCGFIGGHLVEDLLADGHAVRVLDDLSTGSAAMIPPRAELIRGDVAHAPDVAGVAAGVDGIFHLAAIASVPRCRAAPERARAVNRAGTGHVLAAAAAARGAKPAVVLASSAAVYGDAGAAPAPESRPPAPLSCYGADKLAGERLARRSGALGVTALRFFNVYGPRQDPRSPYSGVISVFADQLSRGAPVTIHGDGLQTRDFVHVHDVVAHLRAAMARRTMRGGPGPGLDVFNVCTGRAMSLLGLVAILARGSGTRPVIRHVPARPDDIRHSVGDPAQAHAALGVSARWRLEDGLTTLGGLAAAK